MLDLRPAMSNQRIAHDRVVCTPNVVQLRIPQPLRERGR
jgi:hypothetical protein